MSKVVIIPLDKICVEDRIPIGSQPDYTKQDRLPYWKEAILKVNGMNVAGYALYHVPEGQQSRRTTGGPFMPGPWASASARAGVIDTRGGTRTELAKARVEGRIFDADLGDLIQLGDHCFKIEQIDNHNIRLTRIEPNRTEMIHRAVAALATAEDQGCRIISIICQTALAQRASDDPEVVLKEVMAEIDGALSGLRTELKRIGVPR